MDASFFSCGCQTCFLSFYWYLTARYATVRACASGLAGCFICSKPCACTLFHIASGSVPVLSPSKAPLAQTIADSDRQRCNGSRQQWWTGDSCGCAREGLQPPRQRGRLQLRRRLAQLADQRRCLRARQGTVVRLFSFRSGQTVGGFERGGQLLGRILEPSRPARKSAP